VSRLEADARAREYRDLRAAEFAATLVGFALLFALFSLFTGSTEDKAGISLGVLGGSLGLALSFRVFPERARGITLCVALGLGALAAAFGQGIDVVGGPLLVTLPLSVTVLLGPRQGAVALVVLALALATAPLGASSGASSVLVTIIFLAMVMGSGVLLRSVLEDADQVFEEFDEARASLETAGKLRAAAEEARDQAIAIRNEARSLEALGVVAGSAVHDLNNMAQVIRTWADEVREEDGPLASRDAASQIVDACDRVTNLAADVLMLGHKDPEASGQSRVRDALPIAARALRRLVRETIRIVVDPVLDDDEEPLPVGSADLVHIILETAAAMNIGAVRSGTLIISAPRANEVDGPAPRSGMRRHPFLLALELRADGKAQVRPGVLSGNMWVEDREIVTTAEVRVLSWCPTPDSACISFDVFPLVSSPASSSTIAVSLRAAPSSPS
jgi:signal transduction histidine kinase